MDVTAVCERTQSWWAVSIPEVPGAFTQVKRLDQAPEMAADAVALLTGLPVEQVHVHLQVQMPDQVRRLRERAAELQRQATELQGESAAASRSAVAALRQDGLSMREIGLLLGLSPQRVSQLQRRAAVGG